MTVEEKLEHLYRAGSFVLMEYLEWDNKLKTLKIGNGFKQKFAVLWHIFIGKKIVLFFPLTFVLYSKRTISKFYF